MNTDNAARARSLDTSTSFIVQAPAGSGKTELLIQRYLKLLEIVPEPDAVVAITFTRKAAGEMRARVIDALWKAARNQQPAAAHQRVTFEIARRVLENDRDLGWNLLQNPARMRIETIDALCASITRRMPWLARFGAMPEISEKAEDLYREAARNTLRHVDDPGSQALSYLLLHLDNDFAQAQQLLAAMLEKREQWLRHTGVHPDFDAVRAELEASLERLILLELEGLRTSFPGDVAAEIALLREMDRFPEARMEDLERWNVVADLLLTTGGTWRKQVNKTLGFPPDHPLKPRAEQLLHRLQTEDELLSALKRYRDLPSTPRFSEPQWHAMQAAVSVLTLAVAELQLVFRERGRVDFAELAIRASEALGHIDTPTDLALALGQHIQHILVDEFQDTSFTQFELLRKLTAGWDPGDGRTLFLVGDPMQSIYRFRQADVGLFLEAREKGIGSVLLEPLTLSANFRSSPGIVDWVNQTFAGIFPPEDNVESGAVSYCPSTAAQTGGDPDPVIAHGFLDDNDEAEHTVELIRNAGGAKVAILVRSRAHLARIAMALKRSNIRYQAIEIDQLGDRPVIEDLMALTFALLHAADRVSWLAILRAPWCGLTLSDLHALAAADHHATIWDLLHSPQQVLSADGAARMRRILPLLEQAVAERGRRPLREWVEGLWLRLGGPACVEDETALEDAAAYLDLLEGIAEGADLSDFARFREQVNALFAQPDTHATDRLQLMTIHKAKGLEFDIVILPGLGSSAQKDEPGLLLWLEQRGELLLAAKSAAGGEDDPIYKYLSHIERRKMEQEISRLLYVAATRARSKLYLLATLSVKDDGTIQEPASGTLLKLLWPSASQAFMAVQRAEEGVVEQPLRTIRRVPVNWTTPAPPPPVEWTRSELETVEAAPVEFEWAGPVPRYTGTAVHGLLQRIAREGLDTWDSGAMRDRRRHFESVLANLGVPPAGMADAVARVEAALSRAFEDSRARWILAHHSEAECELPVAGVIEGKFYEAVIDRTFIDDDGVRWIIDYKTGSHEGGDLEKFLDTEQERYRQQLERYARLMAQRDSRPIRLALYFPLLGGWREWSAPVPMRRQATLFDL